MTTINSNSTLVTKEKRVEIKNKVLRLFYECNIHTLPANIVSILTLKGIILLNSEQAVKYGFIDFIHNDFDGKSIKIDNQYFIIYNSDHTTGRRRWTIAHEIGHIFLGHGEQSKTNEAEANYFARQLLMPLAVLDNMGAYTIEQISEICNVSKEAAAIRQKDFKRHNEFKSKHGLTNHDRAFLKQFGMYEFSKELAM